APISRSAVCRASAGDMPRATWSSMRCSRWYWSSSSSSSSTWALRSSERTRRRSFLVQRMALASSRGLHNQRDCGRQTFPLGGLGLEGPATGRREPVVLGATIVLTRGPPCLNPALLLEFVEGRVQRALTDAQLLVRHLPDPLGNGP